MTIQTPSQIQPMHTPRPQIDTLHQILVITRLTFREARRRSLLWLGAGLGLAFVALFSTGFFFIHREAMREAAEAGSTPSGFEYFFFNMFLMAGLYVTNFLVIMVTVLTSVGTLSGDIESGTVHAIAAKPLRRWQIVLGKWIGHSLLLIAFTLLMAVGVVTGVYLISGYLPNNLLPALGILILEALATLSLTMLGSARLSTLANGIVVFMLYGVAFVGGWVEQIGSLLNSRTAVDLGILSSLFMPSEGLWRYASALMKPDDALFEITPFSVVSEPTPAFMIYGLFYTLACLIAAMVVFSRRDF